MTHIYVLIRRKLYSNFTVLDNPVNATIHSWTSYNRTISTYALQQTVFLIWTIPSFQFPWWNHEPAWSHIKAIFQHSQPQHSMKHAGTISRTDLCMKKYAPLPVPILSITFTARHATHDPSQCSKFSHRVNVPSKLSLSSALYDTEYLSTGYATIQRCARTTCNSIRIRYC